MSLIIKKIARKRGRNHGEVFTDVRIVNYLLNEVGYDSKLNLQSIKILEPAAGTGSFAIEIVKRLYNSSILFNFSFIESFESNVRFIELNTINYLKLINNLQNLISALGITYDITNSKTILNDDYLASEFNFKFDCIVGNPPYIRHELIPELQKKTYRALFETFKYRADLYVLFFDRSLQLLNEGGKLSFICSNRWLYNQYGYILREKIAKSYTLLKLLNMEKASPFDESVLAYPCITTILNNRTDYETKFYETSSKDVDLDSIRFVNVPSPRNGSWQNMFISYNLDHDVLDSIINQGFEIGIGVATGADKIFIRKDFDVIGIEESRLLPIVNARDLTDTGIKWKKTYLINPYEEGNLCELNNYPNLKKYLYSQKEILLKRHVAKKNPLKWYKTIDNIRPGLLSKPKLLLPDIAGINKLIIDDGNFYPHHNLYYIVGKTVAELKILASILMSEFTREQLSQIGICMNGGMPRFQAQTLRKLRIPKLDSIDNFDKFKLIEAYENSNYGEINVIVNKYCIPVYSN